MYSSFDFEDAKKEDQRNLDMKIRFIDLFAGLGGTRIGFQEACSELGIESECVFTSEIKKFGVEIYQHNFFDDKVDDDITKIESNNIPDFEFLLGGFPCQAFSAAGNRQGFNDTRGTLFFDVARIIKEKKPLGFLLENVEGLVTHDHKDKSSKIGHTLQTIIKTLEELGYKICWKVLNSLDFGVPQDRKRIYIIGSKIKKPTLLDLPNSNSKFFDIQEHGLPELQTEFTQKLLSLFSISELEGKSIKDKRGGLNNIHSWDLELKGKITKEQKDLMGALLLERRKKKWAELKGIKWMDGMTLTLSEIYSFYGSLFFTKNKIKTMLDDLVTKKYIRFEHPKDLVKDGDITKRKFATHLEKGYNIVTGKLSFELNKILDPNSYAPTIVATEANRIGVIDSGKIRRLSERECFRLFGYPEWYNSNIELKYLYDLIGNTVVVPVIKQVAKNLLSSCFSKNKLLQGQKLRR